jgi:hypothetical protein
MPNPSVINFDIEYYIISEYAFDRIQEMGYCDSENDHEDCLCSIPTYNDFIEWNIKCFNKLSNERKLLIKKLYELTLEKKVCIMDQESCVMFPSCEIFFNKKEQLVITCPR